MNETGWIEMEMNLLIPHGKLLPETSQLECLITIPNFCTNLMDKTVKL